MTYKDIWTVWYPGLKSGNGLQEKYIDEPTSLNVIMESCVGILFSKKTCAHTSICFACLTEMNLE